MEFVGGVVHGDVKYCSNQGKLKGTVHVGGICGGLDSRDIWENIGGNGSIYGCENLGELSVSYDSIEGSNAGGICGHVGNFGEELKIEICKNNGIIRAEGKAARWNNRSSFFC